MNWKLSNCHYLFGAKCQRYCKSTSLRLGSYDDHFGTWGCCIRMKEVILIVDMWKESLAIPVTGLELDVERYCKSTSLRLRCSWIYVCVSCVFDFKTNYLVLARIEHYGYMIHMVGSNDLGNEVNLLICMWIESLATSISDLELNVERYCKSTSLGLRYSWI